MGYFLLTGSTGLVGRYLVRELLESGHNLAVVVRASKLETASERFDAVMRYWEAELGYALPRPVVLDGNLTTPGLGLSDEDRRCIATHCNGVIHVGASMVFREDQHGEPFRTNVGGMENMLQFCREVGIRRFHHVSTAYICGLRNGRILESEVDLGQELGNVYEQSKLRAEKLVREADFDSLTVYRPASVVGDYHTGFVTTTHGFYLPLQLAHIVADKIYVGDMNERFMGLLGLAGNEGKNLVPVDWLAKTIGSIVSSPGLHNQTYHLASPKPVAVATIQRIIQQAIETYHPKALRAPGNVDLSTYESLFHEYMKVYQSHWRDDPKFDITNTVTALPELPCPLMDEAALMRIARFPIERNFNLTSFKRLEPAFDVAQSLRAKSLKQGLQVPGARSCNFLVNGPGGGQWQILLNDDQLSGIERGLGNQEVNKCTMNSATFCLLRNGKLTVSDSISAGRIVLEGNAQDRKSLTTALEKFVSV
ncbi:SDR family oxidoreductase [Bythopirellula goksoeyrii]|uniref:3 beta-hydroxysteroid dehydrogenase/Delta 5-->4-isomerase n=1 Tax=Bythopirellula goksoeyrii TaxID=1400387 RepID=A0A5B9QLR7_9BACT|nr:SDR family oxidoreductase [Bythopirellula goksoeyrii]QEG35091.1 3 beta-hydroxysteroid dehydrogenase/Delta 5-->4-isomerase [Bythopirellula goksoeyrii]